MKPSSELLGPGLRYEFHEWRKSRIHVLRVELAYREIRPVLAAEAFPFGRIYPFQKAVEFGALATVGGGFNTTLYHHFPFRVPDQPLHAMVVDREIWTTGVGNGGAGVLLGNDGGYGIRALRNRLEVKVWRPDHPSIDVEAVNCGHQHAVQAFTSRGGRNQIPGIEVRFGSTGREELPIAGKHYARLLPSSDWSASTGSGERRTMIVYEVADVPLEVPAGSEAVVLESRWPLRLRSLDEVSWVQKFAAPAVASIVSGWPLIIAGGENVVPLLGLHAEASHGPDNWFIRKNPRMAIGADLDGLVAWIVVVEGRVPNTYRPNAAPSVGLRLKELATFMLRLGVREAVNFDGGGSAFLWTTAEGLVAPGCYDTPGTLAGLRPDHYAIAVF